MGLKRSQYPCSSCLDSVRSKPGSGRFSAPAPVRGRRRCHNSGAWPRSRSWSLPRPPAVLTQQLRSVDADAALTLTSHSSSDTNLPQNALLWLSSVSAPLPRMTSSTPLTLGSMTRSWTLFIACPCLGDSFAGQLCCFQWNSRRCTLGWAEAGFPNLHLRFTPPIPRTESLPLGVEWTCRLKGVCDLNLCVVSETLVHRNPGSRRQMFTNFDPGRLCFPRLRGLLPLKSGLKISFLKISIASR